MYVAPWGDSTMIRAISRTTLFLALCVLCGSAWAIVGTDTTPPESSVLDLAPLTTQAVLDIAYTASDADSGVADVSLHFSKDGGPWTEYGSGYSSSPISFDSTTTGGDGRYEFYTIATDAATNEEAAPATADASTLVVSAFPGTHVYVDTDATGAGTGADWPNAFEEIGPALTVAAVFSVPEVWVAEGTYPECVEVPSSVAVYGGFAGTEALLSERDPSAYVTVLDASGMDYAATLENVSDARLDGLTCTGADTAGVLCVNALNTNMIAGCTISGNLGHGIFGQYSSTAITDCVIMDNEAAGVYCFGYDMLTLIDCTISGNALAGAEYHWWGWGKGSTPPIIADCIVAGNLGNGLLLDMDWWTGGDPFLTISGCTVAGNALNGIYCSDDYYSAVAFINCVISGNQGHGMHFYYSSPTVANCTIGDNAGDGAYCDYSSLLSPAFFVNTVFDGNAGYGIYESNPLTDPFTSCCLFNDNTDGDYYDNETGSHTGASAINTNVAEASDNVDGDPLYLAPASGGWTAAASYDTVSNRTTLVDASATFTAGALVGSLLQADSASNLQSLVVANTADSVTVVGEVAAAAATAYQIVDYHIANGSPCIDMGADTEAPAADADGNPRPADILGQGQDGTGAEYDIGAYEYVGYPGEYGDVVVTDSIAAADDHAMAFPVVEATFNVAGTVTVENTGTGPLRIVDIYSVDARMGTYGSTGAFTLEGVPGLPAYLPAGESVVLTVRFAPMATCLSVPFLDDVFVATNDADTPSVSVALSGTGTNINADCDGDGLTDIDEIGLGTNPSDKDSDDDGIPDGTEVDGGTLPLDASSFNSDVYVDAAGGSDATGSGFGTQAHPWATIAHAVELVEGNVANLICIKVAEGTYTKLSESPGVYSLILDSYECLLGGYEAGGWTRDTALHPTIIDGSTSQEGSPAGNVVVMDGVVASLIEGFTVTGGDTQYGSEDNGGGILCRDIDSSCSVSDCAITGNAAYGGGGLACVNATPTVSGCTIHNNSATSCGGGIYIAGGAAPVIAGCTVAGNVSWDAGGGVCVIDPCYPVLSDCTISANEAYGDGSNGGGGLFVSLGAQPTVTSCVISGNAATATFGAAIGMVDATAIVSNCTIAHNAATTASGGIGMWNAAPTITDCIFVGNTGVAIVEFDASSDPLVTCCLFYGNPDGDYLDFDDVTPMLYTGAGQINASIAEASENVGGDPVFLTEVSGAWTAAPSYDAATNRTTFTDALASFADGALVGRLINPWADPALQAYVVANTATTVVVDGGFEALVVTGDVYTMVDYHLQAGSPAIDTGVDTSAPGLGSVVTDLDGEARGADGDGLGAATGDGSDYDIGADEGPDVYASVVLTGQPWEYEYLVVGADVRVADTVPGRDGIRSIGYAPDVTFGNGITYDTLIVGTTGKDSLLGTLGNDILIGLAGNDKLNGHNGHDILVGGAGYDYLLGGTTGDDVLLGGGDNDQLHPGAGSDACFGGPGDDFVFLSEVANLDVIDGGAGTRDVVKITDSSYTYYELIGCHGFEQFVGAAGDDVVDWSDLGSSSQMAGNGGADVLSGGPYRDTIRGGAGEDILSGGVNNPGQRDLLYGDDEDDTISAFGGNANCYGGNGDDTVRFSADPFDPNEYRNRWDPATGRGSVTDLVADRDGGNFLVDVENLTY